jgi:hypothetical protein
VTKLPDGRVIKGSRPAQRQNARFWTEINEDTEQIIQQVQEIPEVNNNEHKQAVEEPAQIESVSLKEDGSPSVKKPAGRKPASAVRREKRTKGTEKKPRSTGPKPSQRGFKWPTS